MLAAASHHRSTPCYICGKGALERQASRLCYIFHGGGASRHFAFGEERTVMSTVPSFSLYGRVARISRPKLRNIPGEHEAVLLPDGRIAHATAGRYPEIVSYQQYAEGLPVRLIAELEPSQTPAAIRRLNLLLRQRAPYDFFFGNCETFSRKVMGEPGVSWQVVTGAALAFGLFKLFST